MKRIFGVPLSGTEQSLLSEHYLKHRAILLRAQIPQKDEASIVAEAVRQVTADLDEYLNQIASRSQTLLAVVAILIAVFLQIGSTVEPIRWLCIGWALGSISLFYNIWLFFGPTDAYASIDQVYRQTVKLAYRRSLIFNGNIVVSAFFCLLVVAASVWFHL